MRRTGVLLGLTALITALSSGTAPSASSESSHAERIATRSGVESAAARQNDLQKDLQIDLRAIAQNYLTDRAARLTTDTPPTGKAILTDAPVSTALSEKLAADAVAIDQRRELLRSVNGGHQRAEVAIIDARLSEKDGTATLAVVEQTKLFFARPLPGAPEAEEYRLRHQFTFAKAGDQWELTQATPELTPGDTLAPDTHPQTAAPPPPRRTTRAEPDGESSGAARPKQVNRPDKLAAGYRSPNAARLAYDYWAMVEYAYRYVHNYNPNYRTYAGEGGDCTNFLSQILKAGGWAQTGAWPGEDRTSPKEWFYGDATWTTTYTWSAAENWYQFARNWSGRVTRLDNIWNMGLADVLQLDGDGNGNISHSMLVTDYASDESGNDELYLTYHSSDTKDKPLSSIVAAQTDDVIYYAHRT